MQTLRGSGSTFSTSGKSWRPFRHDANLGRKLARNHRIKTRGFGLPTSKAELRAIVDQIAND